MVLRQKHIFTVFTRRFFYAPWFHKIFLPLNLNVLIVFRFLRPNWDCTPKLPARLFSAIQLGVQENRLGQLTWFHFLFPLHIAGYFFSIDFLRLRRKLKLLSEFYPFSSTAWILITEENVINHQDYIQIDICKNQICTHRAYFKWFLTQNFPFDNRVHQSAIIISNNPEAMNYWASPPTQPGILQQCLRDGGRSKDLGERTKKIEASI